MHNNDTGPEVKAGRHRALATIWGLAAFFGIAGLSVFTGFSQGARLAQFDRVRVLLEASTVRTKLESGLNERISLERGIVAFVASEPGMNEAEYTAFADALMLDDPVIKNLAVLEGTTIKYVYPYEPNKTAIGKDLSLIPEQAGSVSRAMASREPVVAGPYALVQGGVGVVSRMGIYPVGPEGPRYWGQASVVIDSEAIFTHAGASDHPDLLFMLGSKAGPGTEPMVIHGDISGIEGDPVVLDVNLPGICWSLSAVPREGWKSHLGLATTITAIGLAIAGLAGLSIYGLLVTRAALKQLAYHDHLTELPNRSLFWDRLRVEASRTEREGTSICIYMIDLDDFKKVNDEYGHEAGDRLLAQAAARMSAAIRKSDTVARIGGDEFAVIAPTDGASGVEELTARLRGCFKEPFDLGLVVRTTGASIGRAIYPDDGPDVEAVLAVADHRMYAEKRAGKPS
ncbi:MAG: hypothetical protein CVV51_03275 [Spirochaetae bacterium HGW-Spirochaetae-7]|jgi:diguanylate cyclase (GGDEF)-like protein|nr:MAG: hypothetical protein CVV51_03275 [Spirochaetae bacterium HGW-Spirochaetae-7]